MLGVDGTAYDRKHLGVFIVTVLISLALCASYLVRDYGKLHAQGGYQKVLTVFNSSQDRRNRFKEEKQLWRSGRALDTVGPHTVRDDGDAFLETKRDIPAGTLTGQGEPSGVRRGQGPSQVIQDKGFTGKMTREPLEFGLPSPRNVSVFSDEEDVDSSYDGCSAIRWAPPTDQCKLAKERCASLSGNSLLDYMSLHYCFFGGNPFITVPLYTVGLMLAFYLLADTAENFFCPTVTTLSEMLDLSPNTAGVTLLALGNGAPDLLGSVSSFSNGDPHIIVGAILSAGTFVTSFVVGSVALFVAPFPVEGPAFVRDAAMYALGVILALTVYSGRVLHFWQAAGLIAYYILFVGMVIYFDRRERSVDAPHEEEAHENHRTHPHTLIQDPANSIAVPSHLPGAKGPCTQHEHPTHTKRSCSPEEDSDESLFGFEDEDSTMPSKSSLLERLLSGCDRCHSGKFSSRPHTHLPHSRSLVCAESSVGRGITSASSVFAVVKWPIHFVFDPLRWATVPTGQHPLEQDTYYRIANTLFCPAVLLWGLNSTFGLNLDSPLPYLEPVPVWVPFYFTAVLAGAVSLARGHSSISPLWPVVASFVMSITWVGVFARELLGLLSSLGAVLGASDAILGVTVLAWGNSIGDLVTNVTMALSGQPMMAVAGCFAGPLFNLMLGLGIPLTAKTAWLYPSPWQFQEDPQISVVFPFLLTSVLGSLCVVPYCSYKVTRVWGFFLIILYLLFILVSVGVAILCG